VVAVAERIAKAGGYPDAYKLARQVNDAFYIDDPDRRPAEPNRPPRPVGPHPNRPSRTPQYNPDTLMIFSARLGLEVTPEWLYQRSPLHPDTQSPSSYLRVFRRPGSNTLLFTKYNTQGCRVWTCPPQDASQTDDLSDLREGHFGVWFLNNEVDGEWRDVPRLVRKDNPTGRTRRAQENVTSWEMAVLETDVAPRQAWLNMLAQLPIPIVSVTDTGSDKGPHALVRFGTQSKDHWDEVVRYGIGPQLAALGADYKTLTAVRLTRLPNCRRGQTGRMQRLLYLNPSPDSTPLCDQPVLWPSPCPGGSDGI
jgi:hypothetical protein